MKGWKMFAEIKKYKEMGLNKSQVERKLDINYKTVDKYWYMSHEEYASLSQKSKSRKKKLEKYEVIILDWLKEFNDISAAQVNDWIKERYNDFTIKDRTLRNFIQKLSVNFQIKLGSFCHIVNGSNGIMNPKNKTDKTAHLS